MKKKPGKVDTLTDPRTAELRESFHQCDADKDGYIQYREFATLLDNLGAEMSAREAKIGFQALDTDDDQVIDFSEFLAWWNDR